MITYSLAALMLLAPAADLTPVAGAESVAWGKKELGYIIGADKTVSFELTGRSWCC